MAALTALLADAACRRQGAAGAAGRTGAVPARPTNARFADRQTPRSAAEPPPGRPALTAANRIIADVDAQFPCADERVNREAVQVLVYLHAPSVVGKTLRQMAAAQTQPDMIHYLFHLRTMPIGFWTLEQRKEYFAYWRKDRKGYAPPAYMEKWFADAGRSYSTGASYPNFMRNFFREAVANLSDAERKELAGLLDSIDKAAIPNYDIKPRAVVKQWKVDELIGQLDRVERGRNFERGREAFLAGQCIKCHRFGEEGGAVGPELTAISARFSRRDILESILEPSKVVSDQYQNIAVTTTDGKTVVGRLVDETDDRIAIQPDPLSPQRVEIKKSDLETREPSKVSPMPANLADVLTGDEILDLIAYLESGGNRHHRVFRR
ncbi:MAG: c-type cytochrome [Gemmataceae bacterium]